MGVEGGASCGEVLLFGEDSFQLGIFLHPIPVALVKGLRNAAPANVASENFLLFRRGLSVLVLNLFQESDSLDVAFELCLGSAGAESTVYDTVAGGNGDNCLSFGCLYWFFWLVRAEVEEELIVWLLSWPCEPVGCHHWHTSMTKQGRLDVRRPLSLFLCGAKSVSAPQAAFACGFGSGFCASSYF